tara:strand:- start:1095 stop:1283 length:189 start_codon:yes stop_codon:yes gene_type:complete
MNSRRYNSEDFVNSKWKRDEVIVDMNDIKGLFREWMMVKIDEDLEDMIKKYMKEREIKENRL